MPIFFPLPPPFVGGRQPHAPRDFGPPLTYGARRFVAASSQKLQVSSVFVQAAPLSIAAWVKVNSAAVVNAIGGVADGAPSNRFWIDVFSTGVPRMLAQNTTTTSASASAPIAAGTWVLVVGTQTNATLRDVAWNGSNQGTDATSKTPATPLTITMIGFNGSTGFMDGDIGAFGMWKTALTLTDQLALFSGGPGGIGQDFRYVQPNDLVCYWRFDTPSLTDLVNGTVLTNTNTVWVTGGPAISPYIPPVLPGSDRVSPIIRGWQPPDPFWVGGQQPSSPRPLLQPAEDVTYVRPQQLAWRSAVLSAWQPPDPYWIGGKQPSAARPLSVILEDGSYPSPRDMRWLDVVLGTWRAPDPMPWQMPSRQTISGPVVPDDPPRRGLEQLFAILRSWQPPDPMPQRQVPTRIVSVDQPPRRSVEQMAALVRSWQPPDPMPQARYPAGMVIVSVDRPPVRSLEQLYALMRSWQPPDPMPWQRPAWQTITFVPPPPDVVPPSSRFDVLLAILLQWYFPDPMPQPLGYRQVVNVEYPAIWTDVPPPDADIWTPVATAPSIWTDSPGPGGTIWTPVTG